MPNAYVVLFVLLPGFFIVLITVVGRLEKRLVWQYGEGDPGPEPPYPDSAGYAQQWASAAMQSGFTLLGWGPDPRAPGYRISYALLISPERDCFAVVSTGSIFKLPTKCATIYSKTMDDQVFYTTNDQSGVQIDLLWRSQLAPVKTFGELLERQRSLLRDKNLPAKPFAEGREIEEFKKMREERYETMSRRGWIDYLDGSRATWHFTLWGSLRYAMLNYSIGMIRAKTGGRKPRCV